jgi:hypothetical protein
MIMYAKHFGLNTERLNTELWSAVFLVFLPSFTIFWLGARKTNIFELVVIPGILSILDCLINVTYRVQNISYSRVI